MYLWQILDEIVSVSFFCCLDNVFHGHSRATVAYVLSNGCGKQHWLLLHNTDERAQPLDVQSADVMAVQRHLRTQLMFKDQTVISSHFFKRCVGLLPFLPVDHKTFE